MRQLSKATNRNWFRVLRFAHIFTGTPMTRWKFSLYLVLCGFLAGISAEIEAATVPRRAPFNITGAVTTATGTCPYATGTAIEGYAFFPGFDPVFLKDDIQLMISPSAPEKKAGYTLKRNDTDTSSSAILRGQAKVVILPNTNPFGGSYALVPTYDTPGVFTANLKLWRFL